VLKKEIPDELSSWLCGRPGHARRISAGSFPNMAGARRSYPFPFILASSPLRFSFPGAADRGAVEIQ
jgi:hypothetical protein